MPDPRVALDTTVAQKRPVTPDFLDLAEIHFGAQDLFTIVRGFREHAPTATKTPLAMA